MDWRKWLCIWTLIASGWAMAEEPAIQAPPEAKASSETADTTTRESKPKTQAQTQEPAKAEPIAEKKTEPEPKSKKVQNAEVGEPTIQAPEEPAPIPANTPVATPVMAPVISPAPNKVAVPQTKPKAKKVVKKRLSKKERLALKKEKEAKLKELQTLADKGEYKQGYDLASSMLDDHEGQDKFDFYYGLHALESGHANEASFTFERLTLLNPQILRYRLELARALFHNNNLISAKNEFEVALASEPPKNVQENIRSFLKRIKNAQRGAMHHFNGGLDMAFGFDSNINSATEEKGVTFPDIGFITLQDKARSLSSSFKSLNTKFNYSFSPKNRHSLDASFSSTHKRNDKLSNYDLDVINTFLGYSWQPNRIRLQGGLNLSNVSLDGKDYQSQNGINGMAIYTNAKKTSYGLNFNIATRESKSDSLPDADVLLFGFNANWLKGQTEATSIALYIGDESVDDTYLEHFGKTFFGANYNNKLLKSRSFSRTIMLSLHSSSFQAVTPIFNKKRSDTSVMASWGYEWKPWKYISWHGEASLNHNASNLDLYTYYRAIISIGIRASF